jgi:hypothetical protein
LGRIKKKGKIRIPDGRDIKIHEMIFTSDDDFLDKFRFDLTAAF